MLLSLLVHVIVLSLASDGSTLAVSFSDFPNFKSTDDLFNLISVASTSFSYFALNVISLHDSNALLRIGFSFLSTQDINLYPVFLGFSGSSSSLPHSTVILSTLFPPLLLNVTLKVSAFSLIHLAFKVSSLLYLVELVTLFSFKYQPSNINPPFLIL